MNDNDLHYHPMPEIGEVYRKNLTAVKFMDEEDAEKLWDYIQNNFHDAAQWALIPEEEPDEFDLEMFEEIKNDPDCHMFASAEDVERLLLGYSENEHKTA